MKYFLSLVIFFSLFACNEGGKKDTHSETDTLSQAQSQPEQKQDSCRFVTTGRNNYFILEPGYQLTLQNKSGKSKLEITVTDEIKKVNNIDTRVVVEKEWNNGDLMEMSRNFMAICEQTNTVHYFGEEVNIYDNGEVVSNEGAWIAEGKNRPGILMPGDPKVGIKYYQEMAPGVAMDRAEIQSMTDSLATPAGIFINCLKTLETTPLETGSRSIKLYAPGIGLIRDGSLMLVKHGTVK